MAKWLSEHCFFVAPAWRHGKRPGCRGGTVHTITLITNGLVTQLTYNWRGEVTSRVVGGQTTKYEYDKAGQLTQLTGPSGLALNFDYDPAHRLNGISDGLGASIAYTLDAGKLDQGRGLRFEQHARAHAQPRL